MKRNANLLKAAAVLLLAFSLLGTGGSKPQGPPPVSEAAKKAAEAAKEAGQENRAAEKEAATKHIATFTPRQRGVLPQEITPGRHRWQPGSLGGPTPYNCLEWSFCSKAAWAEPVPQGFPGYTPIDLISLVENQGFSKVPVDCNKNAAHLIMLIWHVPEGEDYSDPGKLPPDENWKHAMKRLDGKWSSKNGEKALFEDIPDPDAFVDKHYAPKKGFKKVVRCFAKP